MTNNNISYKTKIRLLESEADFFKTKIYDYQEKKIQKIKWNENCTF